MNQVLVQHDDLILRPADEDDRDYVLKTWLRTNGHGSNAAQNIGKISWGEHRALILTILARAAVLIAAWAGDPTTIIGFSVTEAGKVHFVYVRKDFWRGGIAKRLLGSMLRQENVVYTHKTRMCEQLPIPKTWTFNPYLAK